MKTKLIILTAAAAVLLYSCSNDRDEDVRKEAIEKVKASNQNLKLNRFGAESKEVEESSVIVSDTIRIINSTSGATTPINSTDPDNGSEVVDPTKPDKPW